MFDAAQRAAALRAALPDALPCIPVPLLAVIAAYGAPVPHACVADEDCLQHVDVERELCSTGSGISSDSGGPVTPRIVFVSSSQVGVLRSALLQPHDGAVVVADTVSVWRTPRATLRLSASSDAPGAAAAAAGAAGIGDSAVALDTAQQRDAQAWAQRELLVCPEVGGRWGGQRPFRADPNLSAGFSPTNVFHCSAVDARAVLLVGENAAGLSTVMRVDTTTGAVTPLSPTAEEATRDGGAPAVIGAQWAVFDPFYAPKSQTAASCEAEIEAEADLIVTAANEYRRTRRAALPFAPLQRLNRRTGRWSAIALTGTNGLELRVTHGLAFRGVCATPSGWVVVTCSRTKAVYAVDPRDGRTALLAGAGWHHDSTELDPAPQPGTSARFGSPRACALFPGTQHVLVCGAQHAAIRAVALPPFLLRPKDWPKRWPN